MAWVTKNTGVRTRHPDYEKYLPRWTRCRDAMEGQDAIYAGGEKYLPKLVEQTPEQYKAYQQRAPWYNASWRTTAGLVGMMFRKPPKREVPKPVEPMLDNINMEGDKFDRFVQNIATDVLEVGRIGLMTDHPPMPVAEPGKVVTQADVDKLGLRPFIKSYEAETIINWKYRTVKNQTVLCLVVLEETIADAKNEFSQETKMQWRVLDLDALDLYRVRVFQQDAEGKDVQIGQDVYPLMDGKPLEFIPFVFIGADGTNAKVEAPPQIDLVDVNLSHWKTTADYEHGMHFSALPTFYITGYTPTINEQTKQPEKIYLGSQAALTITDAAATVGYAEVQNDFEAHRKNLDAKKQEMATLGARMLADSSDKQVETFGATAIKHVGENSILAAIAISVSDGVTIALKWLTQWGGQSPDKVVYEINRKFLPVQMDSATLTAIMSAWQGGMLSEVEMFDLLKAGDVIDGDKTLDEHQEEIDAAPPPAPAGGTTPGKLGTEDPEDADEREIEKQRRLQEQAPKDK